MEKIMVNSKFFELIIDPSETDAFFMLGTYCITDVDNDGLISLENIGKVAKQLKVKEKQLKLAVEKFIKLGIVVPQLHGMYKLSEMFFDVNPD